MTDPERMDLSERFTHPRTWLIGGLVALLLLAGGAFLLLGDGDDGGLSLTPLAQAAERTAEYPGARMTIEGRLEVPGSGAVLTMEGEGEYNGKTGLSRITVGSDLPPEAAAQVPGGRFEIEQVAETRPGTVVMYMRSPAFGRLPGGAEWMKLDLSEQVGGQMQSLDPRDQLKMLRSSEDFEELGSERVRGVPTTRYKATVDQGDEVERLRDEGEDSAADYLEKIIEANDGVDTVGVEAWVARDKTIRRLKMKVPFSLGTSPAGTSMLMTLELYDFGIEPDIELPSESDVFDATEIAREELDRLAE
jgi:hypothetical protein